jgi:hypothetical protein
LECFHISFRFPPIGLLHFVSAFESPATVLIVTVDERPGQDDIEDLAHLMDYERAEIDDDDVERLSDRIDIATAAFPPSWKWWRRTARPGGSGLERRPPSLILHLSPIALRFR